MNATSLTSPLNVLLLYPEFPDTFWSFKHALWFVDKKASSPPLGLATVAAMLPPAWNKRLVDLNISELQPADLEWADCVMISAMVVQRDSALALVERCKRYRLPVIAGGPLFTSEWERFAQIDHFVLNEAEITLPRFLADLVEGKAQRVYATDAFPDITQTPVPLWEIVNLEHYESMSIQYSRGCPFGCDFCNVTALLGHRPRTKSAKQIIAELDKLYALGWRRNVFFVDDNFIGNKRELKEEILPALIAWRKGKQGCHFLTEASINLADDQELMELMRKAGFVSVFVGIETPSEESLAECHKTQNKGRNLVESVRRLQRHGLQVMGGFIVGFDSDTQSIFQRQIDFIQKSGIVTAMVGLLQAPAGTALYRRLQSEGRLLDEMSGDNADGCTNIIPKMPFADLRSGYRQILEGIYSPAPFYARVRNFLREYQPGQATMRLTLPELRAFFRSIYWLGIRGKERIEYWRLFFWALFQHPRKFALAITLAIYGFHFNKVFEQHILPNYQA